MATRNAPVTRTFAAVPLLALAVGAGLVTGALTSFGQTVLPSPFGGLANAVSPWLVVPFLVGALARRWPWAAVAGVLACAAQVAGYYVTADLRGYGASTSWVLFWLVCALAGGSVAGAAGRAWRRDGHDVTPRRPRLWRWRLPDLRGLGGAVLVAVWFAESTVTYAAVLRYVGDATVFALVAALAFLLLGLHGRQHVAVARWLLPAAAAACGGFAALQSL